MASICHTMETLKCSDLNQNTSILAKKGSLKESPQPHIARTRYTRKLGIIAGTWLLFSVIALYINVVSVDWNRVPSWQGVLFVLISTVIHAAMLEMILKELVVIWDGLDKLPPTENIAPCGHLHLLINYNILAVFKEDIEETFETMYQTYMGNLSWKTSCVLVSATSDQLLKQYEEEMKEKYKKIIYEKLHTEGLNFIRQNLNLVNKSRFQNLWRQYSHVPSDVFICRQLPNLCQYFADEFMLIHRVSRVLKKCGQYQDLMLLSDGEEHAFSYTDEAFYGKNARPYGQPLFHPSVDVQNIHGRRFDYTLVLDGDTFVPEGHCHKLLTIAAAHPQHAIIQPEIRIVTKHDDTIFMRLENMKQQLGGPAFNAMANLLGQTSFFGKGLIKNRIYVDSMIGSREQPIEMVPIDVLSHDTFEAACLQPYYASDVFLVESPCRNYISWNIRESRWNTGDMILGLHFWPKTLGRFVRWLQSIYQKHDYTPIRVRTTPNINLVTAYIAQSAFRVMIIKLALIVYLPLRWADTFDSSGSSDLYLVLLFLQAPAISHYNYQLYAMDLLISSVRFFPDVVVGVHRLFSSVFNIVWGTPKWIPQRAVEMMFQESNTFLLSFQRLWFHVLCSFVYQLTWSTNTLIFSFLTSISLPIVCYLTALPVLSYQRWFHLKQYTSQH